MDLVNLGIGDAAFIAFMGYLVVFIGLILLMIVIIVMGRIMMNSSKKAKEAENTVTKAAAPPSAAPTRSVQTEIPAAPAATPEAAAVTAAKNAAAPAPRGVPGSAGQLALYDTDPREAAMVMAIIADTLGKPLGELRFVSIREVK